MAPRPKDVVHFIGRSAKRVAVSVLGAALIVVGVIMLVLPGPGIVVIVLGFAVLATEYAWAASALERSRRVAGRAASAAKGGAQAAGRRFRRS